MPRTEVAPEVLCLATKERRDLADFLDTLGPEQWGAPSLCDGWSVRDVVAHVISYEGLGPVRLAGRRVRGLGRASACVRRLRPALAFALKSPKLPSRMDVRGLHLVATDLDWCHGDGPEVTGPGEALLMAIAGRPAALADLDGPGVPAFAERVEARS